jgi:protoheme IX farnesyltransferase
MLLVSSRLVTGPWSPAFAASRVVPLAAAASRAQLRLASSTPRLPSRLAARQQRWQHTASSMQQSSGGASGLPPGYGARDSSFTSSGSGAPSSLPYSFFSPVLTPELLAPAASPHSPASNDPTRAPLSGPLSLPTTPAAAISEGYRPVPALTAKTLKRAYVQLGKGNLTLLVTLTSMAGYALCPASLAVSSGPLVLLALTAGTAACSAAANATNQLLEAPYDAQMPRTRNRPLPARLVTPLHGATYAGIMGLSGVTILSLAVNPLTGVLGAANIILYAFVYTPLKRVHIVNTWVGSLVGGIPPLMGWTAATDSLLQLSDAPGWLLAGLLFAWQFPHFNALSHNLRSEYARGGYRMMSASHPLLNRRTALRYAIACLPLCAALPLTGAVHPIYALLSLPANVAFIHASWRFWRDQSDKAARWCFWVSLVHLPAVMLLAMVCKTGLWDGLLERLGFGPAAPANTPVRAVEDKCV